ncbi:MAG: amino acid adenylation domain-containing protein [Wenzhouxiangellaceae bacterium]
MDTSSRLIHQLFERQVQQTPANTAVRFKETAISYAALDHAANRLAVDLQEMGVQPGDIVALAMTRSPEMIAAMLAVLKLGAAYLPLDSQSPDSRLRECMEEAGVAVIVANKDCTQLVDEQRRIIQADWVFESDETVTFNSAAVDAEAKAYVMYTSGSTGGPKGVVVPHRAIYRLVRNMNYIDIQPGDSILHLAPPEFDASTFEVWGALLNGATTVLYPEARIDPHLIDKVIKESNISIIFITSALFHLIATKNAAAFATVKYILTGGDVVSPTAINRLFDEYPEINIISCYGPTENTTFTTSHYMTRENRPTTIVPIGRPINGSSVHVLNDDFMPVDRGEPGELFVSGDGVALGYMNRGRSTDSFFVDERIAPGLIYRTGDLVRENDNGELEFIGRKDNQIKLRGFRMSLEEIQAALLELDYVMDAAVVINKADNGEKYLIAFASLQSGVQKKMKAIKDDLREKLPAYMIPDVINLDVDLCINKNGKIDKHKIKEMVG